MTKKLIISIVTLMMLTSCLTTRDDSKPRYSISMDGSLMSDVLASSSWLSYTGVIKEDMEAFYSENPEGEYVLSFNTENNARIRLCDSYYEMKEGSKDQYDFETVEYIDELTQIKDAGYMKEYVYYSFNTGEWEDEPDLRTSNYESWMEMNLPEHEPQTLASVEYIKPETELEQ